MCGVDRCVVCVQSQEIQSQLEEQYRNEVESYERLISLYKVSLARAHAHTLHKILPACMPNLTSVWQLQRYQPASLTVCESVGHQILSRTAKIS